MARPELPRYTFSGLRAAAERFLDAHHPSRALPIPIEEIAELRLRLTICPVPGLRDTLGIDAFTTSDLAWVTVDEWLYEKKPTRYRFTIAHEIGHIVLHGGFYRALSFRSVAEAKGLLGRPDRRGEALVGVACQRIRRDDAGAAEGACDAVAIVPRDACGTSGSIRR